MQFEKQIAIVGEFFKAFSPNRDPMFWVSMIEEETKELRDAVHNEPRENILKELCDLHYVVYGLCITLPELDNYRISITTAEAMRVEIAVVEADDIISMVTAKYFDEKTIDEAFLRVHTSNMSKLGDDGKPLRRSDGKVLKGPNYAPPVLTDLV